MVYGLQMYLLSNKDLNLDKLTIKKQFVIIENNLNIKYNLDLDNVIQVKVVKILVFK